MRSREAERAARVPSRTHGPTPATITAMPLGSASPHEAISAAIESGRDVVVQGEAGIGKTHLVNAALRNGPPSGTHVVNLTAAVLDSDATTAGSLDHLLGGQVVRDDPAHAADALWRWATSRASGSRVLLRLENAQRVDDASLGVIRLVAERPDITLLATSRAEQNQNLVFSDLPGVARFTVRPLDSAGVETLLVELLGGFPTADTVHRLWGATRGNPFYLCELVRDQRARGTLADDDGIWVWTGTATLSPRLIDSALHELSGLSPDERDAVELAAITGPIPAEAISDQIGDRLLRLGLLRPSPAPTRDRSVVRYEVMHPIQADVICALVGTRRRRDLLLRAATWRGAHDSSNDDLVRSVTRNVGAQVDVPVSELVRASSHAVRSDDPHAAVELTSAALRRAAVGLDSVAILTARADAHLHLNDTDAALEDLAEARTTLEQVESDQLFDSYIRTVRLEAMVRHFLGCDLHSTLAMLDRSADWLRTAAEAGNASTRMLEAVEALRLAHVAWGGRHPAMLDEAVVALRETEHAEDVAPLVGPTAYALALAGRATEAEQLNQRFHAVIAQHPALHRWEPGAFTLIRFFTLVLAGELQAAEQTAPMPDTVVDMVSQHQRAGVLGAARGNWAVARHELRAANARLRRRDSLGVLPYTLAVEAMVAAAMGEAVSARALLDELRTTPRRCSLVTGAFLDLYALDALVWLRDSGATKLAHRLARTAARSGQCAVELEALHRLAVVGGVKAAREAVGHASLEERVAWLAQQVQGHRNAALVTHLQALLAQRTRDIAEAVEHLPLAGVQLPSLAPATRLTRREREIASLAAGGMTSKAIAARLVLSVRTVDSHLAGAYAKLGVHSREGLPEALAAAPR